MKKSRHAEWREVDRQRRADKDEAFLARKREATRKYESNPANAIKIKARHLLRQKCRSGEIERKPCEQCGHEQAHAHHHDYSKPLDVHWLCTACHGLEHRTASPPLSQMAEAELMRDVTLIRVEPHATELKRYEVFKDAQPVGWVIQFMSRLDLSRPKDNYRIDGKTRPFWTFVLPTGKVWSRVKLETRRDAIRWLCE